MTTFLRPFSPDDYPAVVGVHNAVMPDYPETVAEWQHWDGNRAAHCVCDRWVAERDGQIIAYGHIHQSESMYHPQKFELDVKVRPEARGQGLGTRLYNQLDQRLRERGAILARTNVREDAAASLAFVERRGFVEEMRTWESRLDVAGFDPRPYAGHEARVLAQGIALTSLAELIASDPAHRRKLHAAAREIQHDVPRSDTYTPMAFESWCEMVFGDQNLYPEGYFIATHAGEIVGMSQLWHSPQPDMLYTGLTGTRRAYRRMGIALALKLRAIAFAQARQIREIRTGNASTNLPMLSINAALGFVKQPAWIELARAISPEPIETTQRYATATGSW